MIKKLHEVVDYLANVKPTVTNITLGIVSLVVAAAIINLLAAVTVATFPLSLLPIIVTIVLIKYAYVAKHIDKK